jgi:uncharacterized protein (UPF0548 family)
VSRGQIVQFLLRVLRQSPNLAAWESRGFAAGVERGPTPRDRRAFLERVVAREAPGDPAPDGPYRRAAEAILQYDIFPPSLVTGVLRRAPVQEGDTVGVCYHFLPGLDLFFAARVVNRFEEQANGIWKCGSTYRTLAGHPVAGEETFSVEKHAATGRVTVALRSWSRPGLLIAHLTRPLMRWLQRRAGRAALDHLQRLVTVPATVCRPR